MVQHHDEWGKTPPHVGGPWVWAPWQHRPTFMLAGAGTPCHFTRRRRPGEPDMINGSACFSKARFASGKDSHDHCPR